jgi:membrane-bound inhibitor of C-type lysozyme
MKNKKTGVTKGSRFLLNQRSTNMINRRGLSGACIFMIGAAFFAPGHAAENDTVKAVYLSEDGTKIPVDFDNRANKVTIHLFDGTSMTLTATESASGARYSDGRTDFWEHHGEAFMSQEDIVIFSGKEISADKTDDQTETASKNLPEGVIIGDKSMFEEPVNLYIQILKKKDADFQESAPTDDFEMMLDAGERKPPIVATCTCVIQEVKIDGDWASVLFARKPIEEKYAKMPIMADGNLLFLMKKAPEGTWQGVAWFYGSETPNISPDKMRYLGISEETLNKLDWTTIPDTE